MNFFNILLCEFKAIFTNTTVVFVILVGSLLYALLYPTPYYNDVVQKQKIAVVDLDNTVSSKDFIFLVNSSPNIEVKYILSNYNEAKNLLEMGEIYGLLGIPDGFETNIYKGVSVKLLYRANASYFLIYGAIIEGLNSVGEHFSNYLKDKKKKLNNMTKHDDELIKIESIPLFNFSIGYINYALAAILVFILHQTLIAGVMILSATQNKYNDSNIKAYFNTESTLLVLTAKLLAFSFIYMILFLLYFGVFFNIYGINVHANIIDFWCFATIFIFSCTAFGVFFGSFIYSTSIPTQIILLSSIPLIFIMGFIYPSSLLPSFLQYFSQIIPAYHGINGFIKLNQMGADIHGVMGHFWHLFVIFAICFIGSYFRYKVKKTKLAKAF